MKKVILAFSGGLDTSFCVLYLKEKGFDVITATIDSGGLTKDDLKKIENRKMTSGRFYGFYFPFFEIYFLCI